MTGSLSVLNVGAGDIEVRFNNHQPEEIERAIKMLKDMQARGYAILVKQDDGTYVRAHAIDAERAVYIVSGEPEGTTKKRGRPPKSEQPIKDRHAVGVARSAGG